MAINKSAKNLYITIDNKYYSLSKTFIETAEKIEIVATEKNLTLLSNKKVQMKGNK
jgi:phage gp45-like